MLLLASKSPRRREIMNLLHIPFTVVSIDGDDETFPAEMPAIQVPEYLARKKADAFHQKLGDDEILVTADTVVILDDNILGKPADEEEAFRMLSLLSGRTHTVATGVCVTSNLRRESFTAITEVTFSILTEEEIRYYITHFHPLDKAGAYGIQEWIGAVAVERIDGSFYNVMGLPVQRLFQVLKKF